MTGGSDNFFEWVANGEHTELHDTMDVLVSSKADWTTFYPIDRLLSESIDGRATFVDVGGGQGFDIEKFRQKLNKPAPGSLVLQDTADCLKNVVVHKDIEMMTYDFFQPQPIKGTKTNLHVSPALFVAKTPCFQIRNRRQSIF